MQEFLQDAEEHSKVYARLKNKVVEQESQIQYFKDQILQLTNNLNFVHESDQKLLSQQQQQYESTIKRQIFTIEQLIKEKQHIQEEYESMILDIKIEQDKRRQLETLHKVQIQSLKTQLEQQFKEKQKQWEIKKTREIREITIKGMEPEINKLITNYEQQIFSLKQQPQ